MNFYETGYEPKHRGEYKPEPKIENAGICTVCNKRPQMNPGSTGIGGALCQACYYDL